MRPLQVPRQRQQRCDRDCRRFVRKVWSSLFRTEHRTCLTCELPPCAIEKPEVLSDQVCLNVDSIAVSLREQVDTLLPGWESWYPSLFEAAHDLGLIRARVCSPDALLLSNRHASVRQSAENLHRERWGGTDDGTAGRPNDRGMGKRPRRRVVSGAAKNPDRGFDPGANSQA